MEVPDSTERIYEQAEQDAARAMEDFVASQGFGSLLAQIAGNIAALIKILGDVMDLLLKVFRIAGRRDVVRMSSQLTRTENKLERVLQEIELLRDSQAEQARKSEPNHPSGLGEQPSAEGTR